MADECKSEKISPLNYYGCMARRIFLAAGVLISLSLSFFSYLIPVPPLAVFGAVAILVFLSGYMPSRID